MVTYGFEPLFAGIGSFKGSYTSLVPQKTKHPRMKMVKFQVDDEPNHWHGNP